VSVDVKLGRIDTNDLSLPSPSPSPSPSPLCWLNPDASLLKKSDRCAVDWLAKGSIEYGRDVNATVSVVD
jgi:hypothetical protein